MGAPRITPEEIITMQRLYRQLGTNAAVAREIGRSESSVSKYMQMKGVPDNIRIAVENLSQKVGEYTMKKWIALLLAAVLCLSLVACGNKVEDIEVNGETVSVTDFLVEHLGTYMNSEGYLEREKIFEDGIGADAKELTVTRVIEISAADL